MREITIDELKTLQVDILEAVHQFCQENNISYGLAYGTLIGGIRHHGYIPWDEDIDILMPRPDYNRFLQSFNGKVNNYKVMAPEINPNYYAPYANVYDERTILIEGGVKHRGIEIGIKIDIFPIDGVPESCDDYNEIMKKMLWYNSILRTKRRKLSTIKGLKPLIRHFYYLLKYSSYDYQDIQKSIMELCKSCDYATSKYVDHFSFPFYPYKRFQKKDIDSFIPVDYEGHCFMCPVGYDDYLKNIYGDYMQLPPEEKRFPHHGFTAYWK